MSPSASMPPESKRLLSRSDGAERKGQGRKDPRLPPGGLNPQEARTGKGGGVEPNMQEPGEGVGSRPCSLDGSVPHDTSRTRRVAGGLPGL